MNRSKKDESHIEASHSNYDVAETVRADAYEDESPPKRLKKIERRSDRRWEGKRNIQDDIPLAEKAKYHRQTEGDSGI